MLPLPVCSKDAGQREQEDGDVNTVVPLSQLALVASVFDDDRFADDPLLGTAFLPLDLLLRGGGSKGGAAGGSSGAGWLPLDNWFPLQRLRAGGGRSGGRLRSSMLRQCGELELRVRLAEAPPPVLQRARRKANAAARRLQKKGLSAAAAGGGGRGGKGGGGAGDGDGSARDNSAEPQGSSSKRKGKERGRGGKRRGGRDGENDYSSDDDEGRNGSGNDDGDGDAGGRPRRFSFLKRNSRQGGAAAVGKKVGSRSVDWSHVKPRTSCRLQTKKKSPVNRSGRGSNVKRTFKKQTYDHIRSKVDARRAPVLKTPRSTTHALPKNFRVSAALAKAQRAQQARAGLPAGGMAVAVVVPQGGREQRVGEVASRAYGRPRSLGGAGLATASSRRGRRAGSGAAAAAVWRGAATTVTTRAEGGAAAGSASGPLQTRGSTRQPRSRGAGSSGGGSSAGAAAAGSGEVIVKVGRCGCSARPLPILVIPPPLPACPPPACPADRTPQLALAPACRRPTDLARAQQTAPATAGLLLLRRRRRGRGSGEAVMKAWNRSRCSSGCSCASWRRCSQTPPLIGWKWRAVPPSPARTSPGGHVTSNCGRSCREGGGMHGAAPPSLSLWAPWRCATRRQDCLRSETTPTSVATIETTTTRCAQCVCACALWCVCVLVLDCVCVCVCSCLCLCACAALLCSLLLLCDAILFILRRS